MTKDSSIDWTKPVRTLDGRSARVLCTDRKSDRWPVIVLLSTPGNSEVVLHCSSAGVPAGSSGGTGNCLENIPEVHASLKTRKTHFFNIGNGYSYPEGAARACPAWPVIEVEVENGEVIMTNIHNPLTKD